MEFTVYVYISIYLHSIYIYISICICIYTLNCTGAQAAGSASNRLLGAAAAVPEGVWEFLFRDLGCRGLGVWRFRV